MHERERDRSKDVNDLGPAAASSGRTGGGATTRDLAARPLDQLPSGDPAAAVPVAGAVPLAAAALAAAASSAARVVEAASMISACGKCSRTQPRHWASGCGCE